VPTFAVEGVAWSVQRIPMAVNFGFLDRSRYFFIQVAPQFFLVHINDQHWPDIAFKQVSSFKK
jgi:hypothetical protein